MSTGNECAFIEVKPFEWYYILEEYNAPKNAWDWREYANAYGPFATQDAAHDHLHRNHANPGGAWIQEYDPEYVPDEMEAKLFAKATR